MLKGSEGAWMSFEVKSEAILSAPRRQGYFQLPSIIEKLYSIVGVSERAVRDIVVELAMGYRYLTSAVFDPFGEKIGARGAAVAASCELRRHYKNLLVRELRGLK
jgi:hypothetical protein